MKSFLFITPLTPSDLLTPLRKELFKVFLSSLKNQTYKDWQALLIGEEEKIDDNLIYKKIEGRTKEIKLMFSYEWISSLTEKPDYIIRIDDDDLISPSVLEKIATGADDFDCYADEYHVYYDSVTGKVCRVKNAWLPNTVIHKTTHALASFTSDNIPLMLLDHSKTWLDYYRNKKIVYAEKDKPVYLRIMSPATQTSKMHQKRIVDFSDEVISEYLNRSSGIGKWRFGTVSGFEAYIQQIQKIWIEVSGRQLDIPKNYFLANLFFSFRSLLRR